MKFALKAGGEVDLLTDDELGRRLDGFHAKLTRYLDEREGSTLRQVALPILLDGSGDGSGTVFTVPVGFTAWMHRLTVDYPGSNAAAPKSCDVRIFGSGAAPSSLRDLYGSLPAVFTASNERVAPMFRGGDLIVVQVTGGPASTSIYCSVQVHLVREC